MAKLFEGKLTEMAELGLQEIRAANSGQVVEAPVVAEAPAPEANSYVEALSNRQAQMEQSIEPEGMSR